MDLYRAWLHSLGELDPRPAADQMSDLIQIRGMLADRLQDNDDRMRKLVDEFPELADRWAEALGIRPGTTPAEFSQARTNNT